MLVRCFRTLRAIAWKIGPLGSLKYLSQLARGSSRRKSVRPVDDKAVSQNLHAGRSHKPKEKVDFASKLRLIQNALTSWPASASRFASAVTSCTSPPVPWDLPQDSALAAGIPQSDFVYLGVL
jgi:hypothetical protein